MTKCNSCHSFLNPLLHKLFPVLIQACRQRNIVSSSKRKFKSVKPSTSLETSLNWANGMSTVLSDSNAFISVIGLSMFKFPSILKFSTNSLSHLLTIISITNGSKFKAKTGSEMKKETTSGWSYHNDKPQKSIKPENRNISMSCPSTFDAKPKMTKMSLIGLKENKM